MFISEGFFCQLVSWPFAVAACSWQQWIPALAGLSAALGLRFASIGRLITFVVGATAFYLLTIAQSTVWSPPADANQSSSFVLGCLFLFPIASVISMCGLLGGDLFRVFRKRARENKAC